MIFTWSALLQRRSSSEIVREALHDQFPELDGEDKCSLRRFVGMVADSRSFLSFTRHEYFRRIFCNLLGADMAAGLLPRDFDMVGVLVEDVCFRNAESFFGFEFPDRAREAASASASALHAPALG